MNEQRLCQNVNALLDRLTYANSSIHIFKSILAVYDNQEQDLLLPDMNFWRVVCDNCCFRALAELAKTYDEGKDSIGLQKLLNQAEQTRPEESVRELVKAARESYSSLHPLRDKLKILRDKGLAHSDKEYASNLKLLVSEHGMPLEDIETLIRTAAEICSDILVAFTGTGRSIELFLNDDASGIIHDLRIARGKSNDRY